MAERTPSTRAIAKVFFTVVVLSVLCYAFYMVRSTVLLIFIALFLAVALGPPVDFFSRWLPRAAAILTVYLLVFSSIVGVGLLVIPPVVSQVEDLSRDIPGYLDDLRKNDKFREYDEKYDITKKLKEQAAKLPSRLGDAADTLRSVTVGVFSALVQLVTVLTIVFFLLLDGKRISQRIFRLMGPYELRTRRVAGDIYRAVSGYVAGNLLISLAAGVTTYLTLTILDVPFAVPLAVLMAFLDLIPLVGATLGGVVILIVTLFNDFPTSTIVWAVVFILYQQVENNVLQPVVYRKTVDVHPLLVIFSILVGSSLLGVLGALVAIPVAATIQIVIRDWWIVRGDDDLFDDAEPELPPPPDLPPTAATAPA
jgi:predicted PurR-regulated permease PerM